jgi:hypothetical protein
LRLPLGNTKIENQQAFQVPGARSVLATLWSVRDDAARSLIIEFYDNLSKKKLSKVEALRQAQLLDASRRSQTRPGACRPAGGQEPPAAALLLGRVGLERRLAIIVRGRTTH